MLSVSQGRNGDYSLVDAMTRGGDPILVEYRTATSVSAREAEKGCPTYGYLPGPSAERCILSANNSRFRSRKQRWYPTLHVFALVSGRNRHHRTRPLLARRCWSPAISRPLSWNDTRGASTDCATRCSRHCRYRGRRVSCSTDGCRRYWCTQRRCAQYCGFLRGSWPSWRFQVGRRYVVRWTQGLLILSALCKADSAYKCINKFSIFLYKI